MMTTIPSNSPLFDLIIIVIGILLFVFRDSIGSMTGYFAKGHYIDKPTGRWFEVALVQILTTIKEPYSLHFHME